MLNNSHDIVHGPLLVNLVHSKNFLVEMVPVQRRVLKAGDTNLFFAQHDKLL